MKANMKTNIIKTCAGIFMLSLVASCGGGGSSAVESQSVIGNGKQIPDGSAVSGNQSLGGNVDVIATDVQKGGDMHQSLKKKLAQDALGQGLERKDSEMAYWFTHALRWSQAGGADAYKDLDVDADGYVEGGDDLMSPKTIDAYHIRKSSDGADYQAEVVDTYNAEIAKAHNIEADVIDAADQAAKDFFDTNREAYLWANDDATNPGIKLTGLNPSLMMLDRGWFFGSLKSHVPTASFALKKRMIDRHTIGAVLHVTLAREVPANGISNSFNFYVPQQAVSKNSSTDEQASGFIASNLIDDPVTGKQKADPGLYVFRTKKYGIYGVYMQRQGPHIQRPVAFALASGNTLYTRELEGALSTATAGVLQYNGRFVGFGMNIDSRRYDQKPSYGWVDMKVDFSAASFVADLGFEKNSAGTFASIGSQSGFFSADDSPSSRRVYANEVNGSSVTKLNTIRYTGLVSGKDDSAYALNFAGNLDKEKHPYRDAGSIAGVFNGSAAEDLVGVFRYQRFICYGRGCAQPHINDYRYMEGSMGASRE